MDQGKRDAKLIKHPHATRPLLKVRIKRIRIDKGGGEKKKKPYEKRKEEKDKKKKKRGQGNTKTSAGVPNDWTRRIQGMRGQQSENRSPE